MVEEQAEHAARARAPARSRAIAGSNGSAGARTPSTRRPASKLAVGERQGLRRGRARSGPRRPGSRAVTSCPAVGSTPTTAAPSRATAAGDSCPSPHADVEDAPGAGQVRLARAGRICSSYSGSAPSVKPSCHHPACVSQLSALTAAPGRCRTARGWPDAAGSAHGRSSSGARNRPVWLPGVLATCSGVPSATTLPPRVAALGAEVDDPVGRLDHVEVVLDDEHRVARVDQPLQHARAAGARPRSAGRWSARRGCRGCGRSTRLPSSVDELHPLRLAARQRRRRLAEPHVAEADVDERLQLPGDRRLVREEARAPPRPACRAPRRCSCPSR